MNNLKLRWVSIAALVSLGSAVADEPVRHLAWLEGNYQTAYEADREVASERLKQWEGKVPTPEETDEYLNYVAVLDASGRGAEALPKLRALLRVKPGEKRAVFLLGVHYLRAKKKELAAFIFGELEKDADFAFKSLVYNNLAMQALEEKNRTLAISYFEKATNASPATPAPYVNLGALYLQSRSYEEAEKLFARALEIDGEFEDAALGLGYALEGQKKFEEAHRVYAQFFDAHSNALSVLYNDAIVLGNRLTVREEAAQKMLLYIQRGGRETARAQEIVRSWR